MDKEYIKTYEEVFGMSKEAMHKGCDNYALYNSLICDELLAEPIVDYELYRKAYKKKVEFVYEKLAYMDNLEKEEKTLFDQDCEVYKEFAQFSEKQVRDMAHSRAYQLVYGWRWGKI